MPDPAMVRDAVMGKGYIFTAKHKANISAAKMGHSVSAETRAKCSAARKGKRASEIARARMSASQMGRKHTTETRARMSAMRKGCKGRPQAAEIRAKISATLKGYQKTAEHREKLSACKRGEGNPQWCGGILHGDYPWMFNRELREEVRRRDGHKCQLCDVPQSECQRALHIHHVDYRKQNGDPVNLVSLCHPCHSRTNTNRGYWMAFFQEKMLKRARQMLLF